MGDSQDKPPAGGSDAAGEADKADTSSAAGEELPDEGPAPGSPETIGAVQVTSGATHGRYLVHVRYGALPKTGTATATTQDFSKDDPLILRTNRGTELALALTAPGPARADIGETVGHVLRKATGKDLADQRTIEDELEPDEARFCKQKLAERGLGMRLSSVEHLFGGERIVFYFTAERRVDFRALVRDLSWHFHARIELRQIGARDEARLLADFEHCGRPLCCKVFLRHLEPVTMRMAKLQRTTLDPQKISGRCGRLMCCLRFEDQVYRELRKGLPHKGSRVDVGDRKGEVLSTDILTQRATVRLDGGDILRVPVTDLRPPSEGEARAAAEEGGPEAAETARAPAAGDREKRPRGRRRPRPATSRARGPQNQEPKRTPKRGVQPQESRAPEAEGDPSGRARGPGSGEAGQDKSGGRRRRQARRRRRPPARPPEGAKAGSPEKPSPEKPDEPPESKGS